MHYDQMTQLALRGVVRDAIRRVIREDGLPGSHHFYITFLTRFPGVDIDDSLGKKYAEEITIVLEHQYWDLKANDDTFEVTLKFAGVPKFLSVPYTAVTRFHDPSVGFALQFDPPTQMQKSAPTLARITPKPPSLVPDTPASAKPSVVKPSVVKSGPKATPKKAATKSDAKSHSKAEPKHAGAKKPAKAKPAQDTAPKGAASKNSATKDSSTKESGSKVVSLDSFRKK